MYAPYPILFTPKQKSIKLDNLIKQTILERKLNPKHRNKDVDLRSKLFHVPFYSRGRDITHQVSWWHFFYWGTSTVH